jgi:hypothetical protein
MDLSFYESTDLVRGLFQKRHGRELSTGKAREIVSAVAQGREYFSAAVDAGLLVRPVLQYYGGLALCRGLILFLSPNLRETSLPPHHGLTPVGWGTLLTGDHIQPADLRVRVANGTFLSMLEHTKNADLVAVFTGPYPTRIVSTRPWPTATLNEVTFRELLSRICELRDVYEQSFGQLASNYNAFVFTHPSIQTDVDIFYGSCGLPPDEQLRRELSIPEDTVLRKSQYHNLSHQGRHIGYRLKHPGRADALDLLPQIDNHEDGTMSVVVPFEGGFSLSRLARFFLLSYFLGTLARYHPTSWLAIMQSRQRGDYMLPIIREATNVLQRYFPALVMEELER